MSADIYLVYVTFPDEETARRTARVLIDEHLAACANIHGPAQSIYAWNGEIQEEREYAVLLKTTAGRVPELQKRILDEHPYDVPCIVHWPIEDGNPDFLDWIRSETLPE